MRMMSVRFVDDCDDIAQSLWDACFQPPREGLWWYRALQNSGMEDQFTFFYGVVEETDAQGVRHLIGIAPCFVTSVPLSLVAPEAVMKLLAVPGKIFPCLLHQRVLFVGSPCSDEGWVGALPGLDRKAVLLAVHDAVQGEARRRRVSMVMWKDIPEIERHNMAWLRQQRRLFALHSYPNALMTFNGSSKDDYFANLKGSRRHQLKKKLRVSAQRVEVEVEVLQNLSAPVLNEVVGLFDQTFERSDVQFERLNRRFFELMAVEPAVHFILLRELESGDLIAFMMCFVIGDLVINKFIGFDYNRPKEWLLYFRLWEAALDWSLSRGASGIQSGQTCYAPKIEQGHDLKQLFNYGDHANPILRWIYGWVAKTITWNTLDDDLARYLKAHPDHKVALP